MQNVHTMPEHLRLEGVKPGDAIEVLTRDSEGEELQEVYNATYVQALDEPRFTMGWAVEIQLPSGEHKFIELYDTMNFDVEDGQLFVVEEVHED